MFGTIEGYAHVSEVLHVSLDSSDWCFHIFLFPLSLCSKPCNETVVSDLVTVKISHIFMPVYRVVKVLSQTSSKEDKLFLKERKMLENLWLYI